jgi:hypothetical protein
MTPEAQTEEVKVRLFYLTSQFTKKYVHRYYKQFEGDINDLIMEYYLEFLTPKSREKGKEQSLLDKYDSRITSLEYLVKVAVQRKLIDSSRSNPYNSVRIDFFQDEYGDCIAEAFGLTVNQDDPTGCIADNRTFTKEEASVIKMKFESMPDETKEAWVKQYREMRSALSGQYQLLFDYLIADMKKEEVKPAMRFSLSVENAGNILTCACQQITDKTVCLLLNGEVLDFNRVTGEARKKSMQGVAKMTEDAIQWVKENIGVYHSGVARAMFC